MNKYDFSLTGGFPFDERVCAIMQGMSQMAGAAAFLGGKQYILSGCDQVGGDVTDGFIVIDGEVLPFIGGAVQEKVVISEAANPLNFFDGTVNNVEFIRSASFGDDGETNYLWADFKRNTPTNGLLARVDKIERMLKPLLGYNAGGVTVYGSWLFWGRPAIEIPAGWEPVPDADWKGRVPVVMNSADADFAFGVVAGSKTATLARTNLPHDKIPVTVPSTAVAPDDDGDGKVVGGSGTGGVTAISGLTTDFLGDATPFKILQPYKVVLFIRFIG